MTRVIDNVSYARDLFVEKRIFRRVGEYVIERETMDTILGLFLTGDIPEDITVTLDDNKCFNVILPTSMQTAKKFIRLRTFSFLKAYKYKISRGKVFITNINAYAIIKFLSAGTEYKDIIFNEEDNTYTLIRF